MTTQTTLPDLVGIAEVADRLGVTKATVNHWRHRAKTAQPTTYRTAAGEAIFEPMPEPDLVLSGTPIWLAATITGWAERTGRL